MNKDLIDYLKHKIKPGVAINQYRHATEAEDALEKEVSKDLADLGQTGEAFQFFLAFAYEVMDRYGRLLCFINRYQPGGEKPLSYNERLLQAGVISPYFIWSNINPFRGKGSLVKAVIEPKKAKDEAQKDPVLRKAREGVRKARREKRGIFDSKDPLQLEPFEIRFLAGQRPPSRWVIDLSKNDDVLIKPQKYYTFFLKLMGDGVSRGKLQAIESDRIATPGDLPRSFDAKLFRNGVKTTVGGTPQAYCVCKRDDQTGQLSFERVVPSTSIFVHGFYERFDQVRGISPLASALNTLQDVYEGFDYALAKMKVSQLFGLVFYRDAEAALQGTIATLDSDGDGVADAGYEVDFGKGPVQLDLNPGDRAEFLEAKTPASETVAFLQMMIHVALKSLDIPYSFFDESFTNFYGSRAGLQQYMKSCETKIADLQEILDEITVPMNRFACLLTRLLGDADPGVGIEQRLS